ncbi:MAG: hypothetical protein Q4P20_11730 [Eubacteriales bacterium]|nr:hypothetical protein [Eubacteriales bacterium]
MARWKALGRNTSTAIIINLMIDFHSHILPGIDDGSDSIETSLAMLQESKRQGVDIIFATPHFYANENDPQTFLRQRSRAFEALKSAMFKKMADYPEIMLGAEILYFPGMSVAEELNGLAMGNTPCLLIEPPLVPWSDMMLNEVEQTGKNLNKIPVIAHVDRYMRIFNDYTLFDRINGRKMLAQVNANYFIRRDTAKRALRDLQDDRFQFIGSDCHNLTSRAQNMGQAAGLIQEAGAKEYFSSFNFRLYAFLGRV